METMNYITSVLPNGLRTIHLPADSPVVYLGYQIAAGSRNEQPGEEGLAHFCEHTTFKGTKRRSAWNILNCLESVGGSLNAYTTKECTVFYAAIPADYVRRAVDLLTDMVFHSVYPQKEIDKEKEVICDEIESYNDSPSDLIYDDFENILFKSHPIGHNILGTTERVRSFTSNDALRFTQHFYRPENMVFFMYGGKKIPPLPIDTAIQREPLIPESSVSSDFENDEAAHIIRKRGTHQAHVMIGSRSYSGHDSLLRDRMSLYLLNNILGGRGMNARLNIVLREHRGLVYTVESSMMTYGDTGLWCTYLGCDEMDVKRCLSLVKRELDKVRDTPLTPHKLLSAKKQLRGQLTIDCDNRENFALDFGSVFLFHNKMRDLEALFRDIDAVNVEDIQRVAQQIFNPERLTTLIYK
ncbi:peptidase M16 [Hallella multisaccharivorax DSM 17128]|uniref:Processing peptidase n=2 Tax=Hallella multisaccharivorax TaxID=310514 RepID=F8NCB2_9BACT|nr:processing peptidase [Hallella multisaccharivorax DSM 17128]GJG29499.1 peptidase M16 [Hallella multisaccharivorax DSM 17128]